MSLSPREILARKREAQEPLLAAVTAEARIQIRSHFKVTIRDAVREVLPGLLEQHQAEGSGQ